MRRSLLKFVIGSLMLLAGLAVSFKVLMLPTINSVARFWRGLLESFVPPEQIEVTNHVLGGLFLVTGLYLTYVGAKGVIRKFFEAINPGSGSKMVNQYVRRQQLANGPRIVALGGGTGLSTLLRGLKQHSSNITAIVTVTDDGGSSGRLVQDLKIIPPGDLRNCLVSLADAEKLMTDIFQYRFKGEAGSLSGHSLGNLLIAALVEISGGDFEEALRMTSEVLAIRGRVLPSTFDHVRLRALMEDDTEICGETAIAQAGKRIRRIYMDPPDASAYREAIDAIRDAELIAIGPGSVFTSVIPNLLIPGIAEAVRQSQARKAYICNVMTQRGESDAFTAAEHVVALQANIPAKVFDYVLVNTGIPSQESLERYMESNQFMVEPDIDRIRAMDFQIVPGNFMSESDYVRHDPLRVAASLMGLLDK